MHIKVYARGLFGLLFGIVFGYWFSNMTFALLACTTLDSMLVEKKKKEEDKKKEDRTVDHTLIISAFFTLLYLASAIGRSWYVVIRVRRLYSVDCGPRYAR